MAKWIYKAKRKGDRQIILLKFSRALKGSCLIIISVKGGFKHETIGF